jgi:hypothetical protein
MIELDHEPTEGTAQMNDHIYVLGPVEVLKELYPDYPENNIVMFDDKAIYEVELDKAISDERVENLTHEEILARTNPPAADAATQDPPAQDPPETSQ